MGIRGVGTEGGARSRALDELAAQGIAGAAVYLLDVVPLFEMMWADGRVETCESDLVLRFLEQHVDRLNRAAGARVLSHADAHAFARRFARERPSPELLGLLRRLVPTVSLASSDRPSNERQRRNILDFCIDIGAACGEPPPRIPIEHFCVEEKRAFEEILQTLGLPGEPGP